MIESNLLYFRQINASKTEIFYTSKHENEQQKGRGWNEIEIHFYSCEKYSSGGVERGRSNVWESEVFGKQLIEFFIKNHGWLEASTFTFALST